MLRHVLCKGVRVWVLDSADGGKHPALERALLGDALFEWQEHMVLTAAMKCWMVSSSITSMISLKKTS